MKLRKISSYLTLAILASCLLLGGCGGSSSGALVTSVSLVSSIGSTLILGQSTNLTMTVVGPTDTDAKWIGCTYTTTPPATTANPNPKATTAVACPSDGSFGTLSNEQTTGPATGTSRCGFIEERYGHSPALYRLGHRGDALADHSRRPYK